MTAWVVIPRSNEKQGDILSILENNPINQDISHGVLNDVSGKFYI